MKSQVNSRCRLLILGLQQRPQALANAFQDSLHRIFSTAHEIADLRGGITLQAQSPARAFRSCNSAEKWAAGFRQLRRLVRQRLACYPLALQVRTIPRCEGHGLPTNIALLSIVIPPLAATL